MEAIESQVERLLPDGISKSARNRVVGEIYRELDSTLRANRTLTQQMRDAFRSGALDANHQKAVVSLITGRARQAFACGRQTRVERMDNYDCLRKPAAPRTPAHGRRPSGYWRSGRRRGQRRTPLDGSARNKLRAHVGRRHFKFVTRRTALRFNLCRSTAWRGWWRPL